MNKSVLVIDRPNRCGECKLYMNNGNSYWCIITGKDTTGFTIPASCPLKPMPEAIPIDWLIKTQEEYSQRYGGVYKAVVINLIEDWRQENDKI